MSSEDAVRITARDPGGTATQGRPPARRGSSGLGVPTELVAFIGTSLAILIACLIADSFDARLAWVLITALAFAYIISRGIAKRGNVRDDV